MNLDPLCMVIFPRVTWWKSNVTTTATQAFSTFIRFRLKTRELFLGFDPETFQKIYVCGDRFHYIGCGREKKRWKTSVSSNESDYACNSAQCFTGRDRKFVPRSRNRVDCTYDIKPPNSDKTFREAILLSYAPRSSLILLSLELNEMNIKLTCYCPASWQFVLR